MVIGISVIRLSVLAKRSCCLTQAGLSSPGKRKQCFQNISDFQAVIAGIGVSEIRVSVRLVGKTVHNPGAIIWWGDFVGMGLYA